MDDVTAPGITIIELLYVAEYGLLSCLLEDGLEVGREYMQNCHQLQQAYIMTYSSDFIGHNTPKRMVP